MFGAKTLLNNTSRAGCFFLSACFSGRCVVAGSRGEAVKLRMSYVTAAGQYISNNSKGHIQVSLLADDDATVT